MIRSVALRRLPALLLLAVAGCTDSTLPQAELVTAIPTSAGITATNRGDLPAGYMAYNRQAFAVMHQGGRSFRAADESSRPSEGSLTVVNCGATPQYCPQIPAGATITIPWSNVLGFPASSGEYQLFWAQVGRPEVQGSVEFTYPAP